jgi:hypothetical protein
MLRRTPNASWNGRTRRSPTCGDRKGCGLMELGARCCCDYTASLCRNQKSLEIITMGTHTHGYTGIDVARIYLGSPNLNTNAQGWPGLGLTGIPSQSAWDKPRDSGQPSEALTACGRNLSPAARVTSERRTPRCGGRASARVRRHGARQARHSVWQGWAGLGSFFAYHRSGARLLETRECSSSLVLKSRRVWRLEASYTVER